MTKECQYIIETLNKLQNNKIINNCHKYDCEKNIKKCDSKLYTDYNHYIIYNDDFIKK